MQPSSLSHRLASVLKTLALAALAAPMVLQAADDQDYSAAERSLFLTKHLANVTPPHTLSYRFHKAGSLEQGFEDKVRILLEQEPDGRCCSGRGEFLSAERRIALPDIEHAEGNPVILYFLERDVRDMQRLTKGQQNHFRKRIRMAIYSEAQVRRAQFDYQGRTIEGEEISIKPYLADPNRQRFEEHAGKEYVFMLSEAVPGGVFGIRTRSGPEGQLTQPLIIEELVIEGGALPNSATTDSRSATTPDTKARS